MNAGDGWKLHLSLDESNYEAARGVLDRMKSDGEIVGYKLGRNAGQTGKDATIYVGAKDAASRAAAVVSSELREFLKEPTGDVMIDDVELAPNVRGRFDIGRIDREFHQYGRSGIPWTNDAMSASMWDKANFDPDAATQAAHAILEKRYGEFYSGSKKGSGIVSPDVKGDAAQPSLFGQPPVMGDSGRARLPFGKKAPPSAPPPIRPGDGFKRFVQDYKPEETLNAGARVGGRMGVLAASAAEPTDFYGKQSGITRKMAEAGIGGEKMAQSDVKQFGGEAHEAKLEALIEKHPGAELMVSKLVRGTELSPAERLVYEKDKASFDKYATDSYDFLEMVRRHDRPLQAQADKLRTQYETTGNQEHLIAAEALEAQRYAIGDLGEGYFPWRNLTWDHVLAMAKRLGNDGAIKALKKGNLDFSREGKTEPLSNSVETMRRYRQQVRSKQAQNPLLKDMASLEKDLRANNAGSTADAVKDFREANVLNERSWLDDRWFKNALERMQSDPEFAAKFKDVIANRAPASKLVGWYNSAISAMLVMGNVTSGITASVSNLARVGSEYSVGTLARSVPKTLEYVRAKTAQKLLGVDLSPEMQASEALYKRLAGLDESALSDITGMEEGFEIGGKILNKARQAAYSFVRWPDVLAKITATEAAAEGVRKANPGWSEQRIETAIGMEVAGVTDVLKNWSRAPLSFNPLYKLGMLFSRAAMRESQQMMRQLSGGPEGVAKFAKNAGIRVATVAAILKMAQGEVDKDKLFKMVMRFIPQSWIIENRAPTPAVLPQKIGQAAQALHVAATGRTFGGKAQLSAKDRSETYKRPLPAVLQQSGLKRLLTR